MCKVMRKQVKPMQQTDRRCVAVSRRPHAWKYMSVMARNGQQNTWSNRIVVQGAVSIAVKPVGSLVAPPGQAPEKHAEDS